MIKKRKKKTRAKIKTARRTGENKRRHEMNTGTKEGNIIKQNAMH